MAETPLPAFKGLSAQAEGLPVEAYFQAFAWEGALDDTAVSAGAFLEAL